MQGDGNHQSQQPGKAVDDHTFQVLFSQIENLKQENPAATVEAARALLNMAEDGGGQDPESIHKLGWAHWMLGGVHQQAGELESALDAFSNAMPLFEKSGEDAGNMAARTLLAIANCLRDLGAHDKAREAYEDSVKRCLQRRDLVNLAEAKSNFATLLLRQNNFLEARRALEEAGALYDNLGKKVLAAGAWRQLGLVYLQVGQHGMAQNAFQQSLTASRQANHKEAAFDALNELALLHRLQDKLSEAIDYYGQATELAQEMNSTVHQGLAMNNMAEALIRTGDLAGARKALERAETNLQAHVDQIWRTHGVFYELAKTENKPEAMESAKQRAVNSYLAYRKDGGPQGSPNGGLISACGTGLAEGRKDALLDALTAVLREPDHPPMTTAVVTALLNILNGSRDRALSQNPQLHYLDAADLNLLLEDLDGKKV